MPWEGPYLVEDGSMESWLDTSKEVSSGGVANPPAMPCCILGISVSLRNFSQLALDSWMATMVQPPEEAPAE